MRNDGKQTYTVEIDGRQFSRRSARAYTHVLVMAPADGGARVVMTWSGSRENAAKSMKTWQGYQPSARFEIVTL